MLEFGAQVKHILCTHTSQLRSNKPFSPQAYTHTHTQSHSKCLCFIVRTSTQAHIDSNSFLAVRDFPAFHFGVM